MKRNVLIFLCEGVSQWTTDNHLVMLPRMICYLFTYIYLLGTHSICADIFVRFQGQEFVELPPLSIESNTFSRIVAIWSFSRMWCSGTVLDREYGSREFDSQPISDIYLWFSIVYNDKNNKYHSGLVITVVFIAIYIFTVNYPRWLGRIS